METINNLAGAASKAIWGEGESGGGEPVSGQKGAGTTNEPYDKGNEENKVANTASADTKAGLTDRTNTETNANTDTTATNTGAGVEDASPADTKTDTTATDSSVKKTEHSTSDKDTKVKVPHTDAEREEAMMSGNFPRDPNDHSGEPLHVHDGSESTSNRRNSVGQEGGQPHGKGTGDKYVKSSGLQSEGGDFDAANAGAGKEANRILEEHGVHKDKDSGKAGPTSTDDASHSSGHSNSGKTSKLDKLKEKLHLKK